jgi:hypothetical protein
VVYVSKGEQLLLTGTSKRVAIQVLNSDAEPVEPASLSLTVHNLQDEVLLSEEFLPTATGTRIQSAGPGTGVYFVDWGDPAAPSNTPRQTETAQERDVLFTWRVSDADAPFVNEINVFQKVRAVSPLVASLTTDLRLRLDKALKPYSPSLADPCFVGSTDFMLVEFLLGGLQHINDYQPYPLWCDLNRYPHECHGSLLIDAAVWYGLGTQQVFAIDTDITNWNDQGNSWVLDHAPKIAAAMQPLYQSLEKRIPAMKWHYVRLGSVRTEISPNYRLNAVIGAAPKGALFRNVLST